MIVQKVHLFGITLPLLLVGNSLGSDVLFLRKDAPNYHKYNQGHICNLVEGHSLSLVLVLYSSVSSVLSLPLLSG